MATKMEIQEVDGDVGFDLVDPMSNGVRFVVSLQKDGDDHLLLERPAARALAEALTEAAREQS
jgi:hypothetical protein